MFLTTTSNKLKKIKNIHVFKVEQDSFNLKCLSPY